MRYLLFSLLILLISCTDRNSAKGEKAAKESSVDLVALLDTIWITEQTPIRVRDSIGRALGFESEAFKKQDSLYHKNHAINEEKVTRLLDSMGWPSREMIGEQGNLTICNVLQHSNLEVREKYLPLMRQAVKDQELAARFLVRAEDRIATDKNELQIYGGQLKYYPETESFNFWPIKDPENLEKRRAEMGLDSIAAFLQRKGVDVEWNVEEQIKRSKEFELAKESNKLQ